jgi:hypothetical protein
MFRSNNNIKAKNLIDQLNEHSIRIHEEFSK